MNKILITNSFNMPSASWGTRGESYPANAVQVHVDGELIESKHIRGVGAFQQTADHSRLEAQAKKFQKKYPNLEIQNNIKKTGPSWDEFRDSLKRREAFIKKNGVVFDTSQPRKK